MADAQTTLATANATANPLHEPASESGVGDEGSPEEDVHYCCRLCLVKEHRRVDLQCGCDDAYRCVHVSCALGWVELEPRSIVSQSKTETTFTCERCQKHAKMPRQLLRLNIAERFLLTALVMMTATCCIATIFTHSVATSAASKSWHTSIAGWLSQVGVTLLFTIPTKILKGLGSTSVPTDSPTELCTATLASMQLHLILLAGALLYFVQAGPHLSYWFIAFMDQRDSLFNKAFRVQTQFWLGFIRVWIGVFGAGLVVGLSVQIMSVLMHILSRENLESLKCLDFSQSYALFLVAVMFSYVGTLRLRNLFESLGLEEPLEQSPYGPPPMMAITLAALTRIPQMMNGSQQNIRRRVPRTTTTTPQNTADNDDSELSDSDMKKQD